MSSNTVFIVCTVVVVSLLVVVIHNQIVLLDKVNKPLNKNNDFLVRDLIPVAENNDIERNPIGFRYKGMN